MLMNLVLGKIPLSQNGRERAVPGHCESRSSLPFVPGLGFSPCGYFSTKLRAVLQRNFPLGAASALYS